MGSGAALLGRTLTGCLLLLCKSCMRCCAGIAGQLLQAAIPFFQWVSSRQRSPWMLLWWQLCCAFGALQVLARPHLASLLLLWVTKCACDCI